MCPNMEWSMEIISEFLTLYEKEPALWNTKIKSRYEQHEAWIRIRNKLQYGYFTIKEIKKKRDNLMATYRKLRIKMEESLTVGAEEKKPDWPFYSVMSAFLHDVYYPKKLKNNPDVCQLEEIEDWAQQPEFRNEESSDIDNETEEPHRKRKKTHNVFQQTEQNTFSTDPSDNLRTSPKDYLDNFGEYIAGLMRHLPLKKALELQPQIVTLITSAALEEYSDPLGENQVPDDQGADVSNVDMPVNIKLEE